MPRYKIENEEISAEIESKGAELKSLKAGEREYMWQADPQFWGRTAPVLFPVVGSLKDKQFRVGDKVYPMGQHGFARDTEFELAEKKKDSATFVLTSNAETLVKFPFKFTLQIKYTLIGRSIVTEWKVTNPGEEELSFSIGGHPAFNCRPEGYSYHMYLGGERLQDFDYKQLSSAGVVMKKSFHQKLENGVLPITKELFEKDALILKNSGCKKVAIADESGNEYLTVDFDADLLGLWSPAGKSAPFVCIEPWYGRADGEDFAGEWKDREYSNTIAPGEEFTKSIRFTV